MARDRGKVEMSNPEAEEEQEIELSLGLSLGRSASSCKPLKQKSRETEANVDEIDRSFVVSDGGDLLDLQRKREMHALRRQEAKKKRDEKQQKKIKTGGDAIVSARNVEPFDDKTSLESQQLQCRVRDREENANDEFLSERNRKTRSETVDQIKNPNPNPNFRVMPVQPQYPQVQYVPFAHGFSFPYVMPCWAPAVSSPEKNVFQPVASRGFRSFQPADRNRTAGDASDHNVLKRVVSTGSLGSTSSSALSDYQSTSQQGGSSSSSDTRSHSSSAPSEQPQPNITLDNNKTGQSEHVTSSHQIESTQIAKEATDKLVSNTAQSSPEDHHHKPISVNKPISITENRLPPLPPLVGGDKGEDKKQSLSTPSMAQMPCVSTTGNGPNGKTITGFLYRYTKTEVSIVCVCHGSSFSPAEFVKHAGGVDVSHPLRHIIVVPSPLG